jgi:hypothetical protein
MNKNKILIWAIFLCSNFIFSAARAEITEQQKADWEHQSMGANPFPYSWFKALSSVNHLDQNGKPSQPLYGSHEENRRRFGLQKSLYAKQYLLPSTGLTVSWANDDRINNNAFVGEDELIRNINGVKSAKFVGINCALCHQSTFRTRHGNFNIFGAPSQVDINGFYTDIVMSTVALFIKKDLLINFLNRIKQQNPELKDLNVLEETKKIQKQFKADVSKAVLSGKAGLLNLGYYWTMLRAGSKIKVFNDKTNFRKIKGPLKSAYLRLYRLTHNLNESDPIGEVDDFATWFSERAIGDPDGLQKTNYFFGRSDAMGSLANAEIRGNDPVQLTAPVGFPWVWGTKYMSFAHYTGNMNSPVHRNIGAALAVGATYSAESNRTSVNLQTVKYLESLMHQMGPPSWQQVFQAQLHTTEFEIKNELAEQGKVIYEKKCAFCHESTRLVGPQQKLRDYKIYSLVKIGTDPNEALNLAKPVGEDSFAQNGSQLTERVANIYFHQNKIPSEIQNDFLELELRGPPIMRETYLGNKNSFESQYEYFSISPGAGYKARHLSGVWATGPFLHNDSVPTLADLLEPANLRPVAFNVSGNFEFDPQKVGLKTENLDNCDSTKITPAGLACIDTTISGNSNRGHEFGTTDLTLNQKKALIEYLKVLPPEPEYSF